MHDTSTLLAILCCATLLFIVAVVAIVALLQRGNRREPAEQPANAPTAPRVALRPPAHAAKYAPIRTLLTDAEQTFFAALRAATPPDVLICPQVRLANLIRPTARNARQHTYDFYRIQAKCVDFVLCDAQTTRSRLVIELDDASHQRADRKQRDDFVDAVLAQVGLPILHIPWQRSYSTQQLAEAIQHTLYGARALQLPVQTPEQVLAQGWATPIKLDTGVLPNPVGAINHELTVVCGVCQFTITRTAKFCPRCGAAFA